MLVLKIFLRDQYKAYVKYSEISWNFNSQKFIQWVIFVACCLVILFVYVGLASYTRFTEEGIYFHRANQLSEEFYLYSQVIKIEEKIFRQKTFDDRHRFLIQLMDGRQWSPMAVGNQVPDKYWRIVGFVSENSGVAITTTEIKK